MTVLRLTLSTPRHRRTAAALLTRLAGVGLLPADDPARLELRVPDAARAVDALAELRWAGVTLSAFTLTDDDTLKLRPPVGLGIVPEARTV